jgi:hypothetical protein
MDNSKALATQIPKASLFPDRAILTAAKLLTQRETIQRPLLTPFP